ncbi:MAG: PadR family transcriptional regulator [Ktedonobacteraceae bacterium]
MEQREAYPITYGILGMLVFWGPLSGYDIKRLFDHTLAPMWGAAHSQIYKELRRMKDLGWVDMQREEQESRPDRKVYSIASAGSAALREWQAKAPEVFQLRDELLLKTLFGTFADPGDLARNLRTALTEHELRLLQYRQASYLIPVRGAFQHSDKRPNPYATESEEDPYFRLITSFAISFENMYIRWLHETLAYIEQGQTQALPRET